MKRLICIAIFAIATTGCPKAPKITVATQQPVDDRNTNYRPGQGALINTARAGKRAAALNDFDQLKTFIFAYDLDNNRMPSKEELRAELRTAGNLLKLIDEGVIILPTKLDKAGLLAYEIDAEKIGGIVIYAGNVSRASADDVKAYLGQK